MAILEYEVEKVAAEMSAEDLFIDVREPAEYDEVHAEGVTNIPLATVSSETVGADNKNKTIYIICRSGKRSMAAAEKLESEGFTSLVNVAGGTLAWVSAGLKTGN